MKLMHVAMTVALVLVTIWATNNIPFLNKITS
jgi:hypothetical protein